VKCLRPVQDIATMSHLSKLVTDSGKLTIEDRVSCLVKLHHVLEMTLMLQQGLSLPHHLLCTAARSPLRLVVVVVVVVLALDRNDHT